MFGIDDIFLLAVPEMFAAAEGTAAIATTAETAAAAEAAAQAAAVAQAAEAAQAAQAAQAASGIMQAAPDVAALTPNNVAVLGQNAGPMSADGTTALNSLPEVQATPSVPMSADKSTVLNTLGQAPATPSATVSGVNATSGNNLTPAQQYAEYSNARPPAGGGPYGTQPGGPYDTSSLSNANDANNARLDAWQAKYDAPGGTDSSFMKGFNAVSNWAEKNPFKAAGLGYMAYSALNKPEPYKPEKYSGPLSKFNISPNFQGRQANPQDFQYTPRTYASGGITDIHSYAKGKLTTTDDVDEGIYRDTDPDTMYLDPLTASMVRQSKLDKRSYVNTKAKFNKPTPMGTLNFDPVIASAAQGGIMGASNLGGYAAGGNPRLLRGPGDGMSDNIPATINNRQPARLADGEFVVPADVVSHLGNGSTEAGAKKLHEMMDHVRKARTGNPKQGKQINPNRFMPK